MDKKMERIIANDVGIEINQIRTLSWSELQNKPYSHKENPFRPQDSFPVGGNISMAQGLEMGMMKVTLSETFRKGNYLIRCLLLNKRHV